MGWTTGTKFEDRGISQSTSLILFQFEYNLLWIKMEING